MKLGPFLLEYAQCGKYMQMINPRVKMDINQKIATEETNKTKLDYMIRKK